MFASQPPLYYSQARVDLLVLRRRLVGLPLVTGRFDLIQMHGSGDLVLQLQELYAQALTNMPCDVTVHDPRTRVLGRVS